jgi:hypothetical protein
MPRTKKPTKIIPLNMQLICECPICKGKFETIDKLLSSVLEKDPREEITEIRTKITIRMCDLCCELKNIIYGKVPDKSNPDFKIFVNLTIEESSHSGYCSDHEEEDVKTQTGKSFRLFEIPLAFGDPIEHNKMILDEFKKFVKNITYKPTCQCCGRSDTFENIQIVRNDEIESLSTGLLPFAEYESIY